MSDIVLKPAKPYTGKAQWQSVRAALKPFVDAGVVTTERFSYEPRLHIDARGWKSVQGYSPSIDVARFWVTVAQFALPGRDVKAEATAALARMVAALTAAGWTVEPDAENRTVNVYGPGMDDWLADTKERRKASEENAARLKAEREDQLSTARAILEDVGLPTHKADNYTGSVRILLTLDDLKKLTECKVCTDPVGDICWRCA